MWVALALLSVWNFGCVGLWMKLHIVLEPRVSSWSHGFRNLSIKIVVPHPHIGLFSHMSACSYSIHHWLSFLSLHMRECVVKCISELNYPSHWLGLLVTFASTWSLTWYKSLMPWF
jgi:hypothetical protein